MKKRKKLSNLKKISLSALSILILTSCGANVGTVSIINTSLEPIRVTLNEKNIVIAPEQHFTQKALKSGKHSVKIGIKPAIEIEVKKRKTTLVDIVGDNCFIVADYTDQYGEKGTGSVKVIEKFVNEKTLTTSEKLTSQLGEELPQGVKGHKKITRLHRVDCSWIDNNQAIVDAIANLP